MSDVAQFARQHMARAKHHVARPPRAGAHATIEAGSYNLATRLQRAKSMGQFLRVLHLRCESGLPTARGLILRFGQQRQSVAYAKLLVMPFGAE
jgi:hypothetical protein